ncbi:MAG: DUF2892 domain-containing protein [Proteobacteria bacterium]|nr:MAG: DUF2892 domain-containing protein [Pseudomonadota bacterium]
MFRRWYRAMEKLRTSSQESLVLNQSISVVRQVQFVQAILILVGVILGTSFSQWFYMLDIVVGLSLLIASLTGSCLLEQLFAKFPWNKPFTLGKEKV